MPGSVEEALLPTEVEYSKDIHAVNTQLKGPLRRDSPLQFVFPIRPVPKLAIYLVYMTIFLDSIAATISTPALPYYAREFGANDADIGARVRLYKLLYLRDAQHNRDQL
eukprot:2473821-Amphidinium_carterae.1